MRKLSLLLPLCISIFLVSCSAPAQTCDVDTLDLETLLISIEDIPKHSSWTVRGPSDVVLDRERTADLMWIGFFSDLYPTYLGTTQQVFRYQTIKGAEKDYDYSVKFYGNGYFPDGWTFASDVADESNISCSDNFSDIFFPVCYWTARYDCIVIEFSPWLIPDRMTLEDMEIIVIEIDQKASEVIHNE